MAVYDFEHVVKYLDYFLVNQDTTVNLKPLTITPVRTIEKTRQSIFIPKATYNLPTGTTVPVIVGQYNYTFPNQTFRISQSAISIIGYMGVLGVCIRFRVGNTVTRYLLAALLPDIALIPYPIYTNQVIQSNFCIEIWAASLQYPTITIPVDMRLLTSKLYNPSSPDDIGPSMVNPINYIDLATLSSPQPETLPITPNANGPWLTN